MIEAAREFLGLFKGETLPPEQRLPSLARALDKLAFAFHEITVSQTPLGGAEPPPQDLHSKEVRGIAIRAFPDFGYYPTIDPLSDISESVLVDDAIDDLVDIRAEMLEVVWRYDRNGVEDAAWYFRFSYEVHWWRHLQNLRGYVFAIMFKV